jgi:pyrroline-5-carboxylate reductase
VVEVDSKLLGIAGTVTGCGPAFVAMVIEALGDAAVKYGVPRATAYELAAQMVAGAGKLAVETGQHPGALKDAVCSPGGTTIRGVAALEEHGLRNALIKAIDAIEG